MKKAADALVDVLKEWDVKRVYGLPGDSIDTTVAALYRQKESIEFVQVRHEEVAALSAAAESKLTGKVSVCLSIGGPGAIHMLNGLYDAKMDRTPVLALLGQVTTESLNEGYFQEVNTPELFTDVSVYNKQVDSPENLASLVDEALRAAYDQKGVAVLTIPDDIPDKLVRHNYHSIVNKLAESKQTLIQKDISNINQMVIESKRPLAFIGVGAKQSGKVISNYLEKNNIPFIATLPGKGIIGDNHPNYLGNVGKLGTKPAFEAMQETDLLLMIGTNYPYTDYLPKHNTKCVQINSTLQDLGKRRSADIALKADAEDVFNALVLEKNSRQDNTFLIACQRNMNNWRSWMKTKSEMDTNPIAPEYLTSTVSKYSPDNTIYSIDVGTSTSWSARFLEVKDTQEYIISSYLGTMGCGLPGAIAAKLNYPEKNVVSICGDGAFSMIMQDFVTAVKYDLPIIIIVLNNQKLAFIEYEQQSAGQENYEIDLANIDFAKFAEACGGNGITVSSNAEFDEAYQKSLLEKTKPTLINAYVSDNAPLPGKIVWSEAKGYLEYTFNHLLDQKELPDLPPLKDIIRQFV